MPLLSLEFIIFFICLLAVYWTSYKSPKLQNFILLTAGLGLLWYVNYKFVVIIITFVTMVYIFANIILTIQKHEYRKLSLSISIALVIINLAIFKYYDVIAALLKSITGQELNSVIIPLGISYYTFQSISYLVTIYNNKTMKFTWSELLLYLSFFPTLTSGPIIRPDSLKSIDGISIGAYPQIMTITPRQIIRPALAMSLIISGIAKKWVVAGLLANTIVSPIFENPTQYSSLGILTAIYGYTLQLFMDFSGYTDMALGIAMLLGFQLPSNFNNPLSAYNIKDFWSRWHITLSTWIRDYIYIPLGGNKKGFVRTQICVITAMVLSGVWHGSGWNFFLWGLAHGIAIVWLNCLDKIFQRKNILSHTLLGKIVSSIITFNFVCFTFVIFKTSSLQEATQIYHALFNNTHEVTELYTWVGLAMIIIYLVISKFLSRLFNHSIALLEKLPLIVWLIYFAIIINLLVILAPAGIPNFIYANF